MAEGSRFVIDATDYPVPSLDSLDTDEGQLLYDLSGLGVEDFVFADDDGEAAAELERKLRNPGFIRALMQIAYQRGNPGIKPATARSVIGKSNLLEA